MEKLPEIKLINYSNSKLTGKMIFEYDFKTKKGKFKNTTGHKVIIRGKLIMDFYDPNPNEI